MHEQLTTENEENGEEGMDQKTTEVNLADWIQAGIDRKKRKEEQKANRKLSRAKHKKDEDIGVHEVPKVPENMVRDRHLKGKKFTKRFSDRCRNADCKCDDEEHLTVDMSDWSAERATKDAEKETLPRIGIPDWSAGLTIQKDRIGIPDWSAGLTIQEDRNKVQTLAPLLTIGPEELDAITDQEWEEVELAVDSGASETVVHEGMILSAEIREGPASRRGVEYQVANGVRNPNLGEKRFIGVTSEGISRRLTAQVCDVNQGLLSVSRVARGGSRVVFDSDGSYIEDKTTNERIHLEERNGMYMLKLWTRRSVF